MNINLALFSLFLKLMLSAGNPVPFLGLPSTLDDISRNLISDEAIPIQNQIEDMEIDEMGNFLTEVLLQPSNEVPLIYIEDYTNGDDFDEYDYRMNNNLFKMEPNKRGLHFRNRKYPYKRQNPRNSYESETRFMCQPSKEDVFRLLLAIHEARQMNKDVSVNFCNRKRPARSVYTNIRLLTRMS